MICTKRFLTSLSGTFTPNWEASPSTHEAEIKNPSTSCCSDLYCCSHCDFSCARVGAGAPLAGFGVVASRCAMHAVYSGGSGITAWPPVAVDAAAIPIQ